MGVANSVVENGQENLCVVEVPSTIITDGQKTGITTAAVQLTAAVTACLEVLVQADSANTAVVSVGGAAPKISLTAGQSVLIKVDDVSKVWAKATTGTQVVNWLARS